MFAMRRPLGPRFRVALLIPAVALACGGVPRDPQGTLEHVRGGALVVGASESPPWLERSGQGAVGPEAELVYGFAESLGAEVRWRWGPLEDHLAALEEFEVDLVAGGLTDRTPWQGRVGLTRPWIERGDRRGVLAVAPGENGFLTALDRHIHERRALR